MKILTIFTCYNRKNKTENSIKSLVKGNPKCKFVFVVVDDNSIDGTQEMLQELSAEYNIHLVEGNGGLFYSGGMRKGMEFCIRNMTDSYDYLLLINDDVNFIPGGIEELAIQSIAQNNAVIVGVMRDSKKTKTTYSAIKYTKGIKYRKLEISEWNVCADTFNANCVLIPYEAFKKTGIMDDVYVHSLGDFDYGMMLRKHGYEIYCSKHYVGICDNNSEAGTWNDKSLGIIRRIKLKENIKGSPTKQWFYYLRKHFNLFTAVKGCITPYLRIMIRK